ncbi:hypothetical protein HDE_11359 [Halotydeus destructor]|nr:hypothetical protein HDE_11359 [Halotydeus destructor]
MDDSMVEDAIQAAKDGDKGHQRHFLRLLKPTPERLAKLGGDKYVQSRTFQAMGEMDAYCEGYFRAKYGGRWRCRIFQGDYHGTPMMQLGTPSLCLRRLLEMTGNDGLHTAMSQAPPTFGQPL